MFVICSGCRSVGDLLTVSGGVICSGCPSCPPVPRRGIYTRGEGARERCE
nr:MAG TPA: Translation initiation factor 2 gamma COMPLEX, TRANSLATION.8A [Caudoviricetes sp.]